MSRPLPNPVFHQEDPSNDTYSSATGAEDALDPGAHISEDR